MYFDDDFLGPKKKVFTFFFPGFYFQNNSGYFSYQ